ncbi:MAG: beta-ketoacyl-[acyl-carrier-protein] synthase family protein [Acidobacteria bacterium]|nr:beta-ketoacyl-[acyl-carrier-protein] synthase family protein [Acidobacteriota bacterium]
MKAPRRIAITGIGVVSALGSNAVEYLTALGEGRCGIRPLSLFEISGCLSAIGGQAPEPTLTHIARRGRLSRSDRFCIMAASESLVQAGLRPGTDLDGFGISLGCSTAGMLEGERALAEVSDRGWSRAPVRPFLHIPTHTPADAVARFAGISGPRLSNMTACSSASLAIGLAADLIRNREVKGMVAGGGDALCRLTYSGFNSLRLLSPRPCRPFDSERDGMSLGEGAGILVLEDWDTAVERGAQPQAEFLDYGTSCDAHHMTTPHPDGRGALAAMRQALERSGLRPAEVDYINAHGTGTPTNDAAEIHAITALFKEDLDHVQVSSTKSMVGHLLGGAGGVESVTVVLALRNDLVPPTLGLRRHEGDTAIDFVSSRSRSRRLEVAISNSFGFGGTNTCLVFRRAGGS